MPLTLPSPGNCTLNGTLPHGGSCVLACRPLYTLTAGAQPSCLGGKLSMSVKCLRDGCMDKTADNYDKQAVLSTRGADGCTFPSHMNCKSGSVKLNFLHSHQGFGTCPSDGSLGHGPRSPQHTPWRLGQVCAAIAHLALRPPRV